MSTGENRWELRGVTCPFAVDSCLSCHCGDPIAARLFFPFPLFSQPHKGRDPFMGAFVRAFANDALSELKIPRFVNLIVPRKTSWLAHHEGNAFLIFSPARFDFVFKLLNYFVRHRTPNFLQKGKQKKDIYIYFFAS